MSAPKNPASWFIYALIDPRDNRVRYVGFTSTTLHQRLNRHQAEARRKRSYKNNWIRELSDLGLTPIISELEKGSGSDWVYAERQWIALFRWHGARLTNLSLGGEGGYGAVRTPEMREKIRQSLLGRKPPALALIRAREATLGKPRDPAIVARIAAANTGVIFSEERKLNIRKSRKKKLSDEAVLAIRAAKGRISQEKLALLYQVTQSTISHIHTGRRCALVKAEP